MTLVEVVIAMFVLAIVLGGALSAASYAAKIAFSSRAKTEATEILNTKLEEMRAMSFADVKKYLAGSTDSPPRPRSASIAEGSCKGGQWARTVTKEGGSDDLLRAEVTVSWNELGRACRLAAVTFISKHGIVNKPTASTSPGSESSNS